MKENEEITNLERFELLIEDCKGHRELYGESSVGEYDIEIMQHILSDYKRVLKENEQLSTEVNSLKEENETLKNENRRLKVIRYSTEYGTENIHLITKSDLVEINTNKYFIEIQDGKFVDLKQVYQENKKLNEYKDNYIPVQKVKDKIEELKSNPLKIKQNDKYYYETHAYNKIIISVLQELIEAKEVE